ncbi:hypothetical protein D9M69_598700 [compost metagenome]
MGILDVQHLADSPVDQAPVDLAILGRDGLDQRRLPTLHLDGEGEGQLVPAGADNLVVGPQRFRVGRFQGGAHHLIEARNGRGPHLVAGEPNMFGRLDEPGQVEAQLALRASLEDFALVGQFQAAGGDQFGHLPPALGRWLDAMRHRHE